MLATILLLILIVAALGAGAWGVLGGAITASSAGIIDDDAERLATIRVGVALLLVGAFLFFAGAMGAARLIGA